MEKVFSQLSRLIYLEQAEILAFGQDYPRPPIFLAYSHRLDGFDVLEPDQEAEFAVHFASIRRDRRCHGYTAALCQEVFPG